MIEVEHLTKRYGSHLAVDDVSFTCEPGTVTGFLGPNGAGKSTTMRMICGLTPPTSGGATVDGVPYHRLGNPGRKVGVLLDASAQHAGRTGREILALAAITMGLDTARIPERRLLVNVRRGEYEELARAIEVDAARRPDRDPAARGRRSRARPGQLNEADLSESGNTVRWCASSSPAARSATPVA